ncbi:MAG TPA: hypothetical protein VFC78_22785 [Tepidisphaeraceae bacterium]|nr:hypothetical protein [Tepidisphaeraceae bacterium]
MNEQYPIESAYGQDEFSEVEASLRQMALRQPTAALDDRIARALKARSSSRSARPLLMGLAAMLAIAAGITPLMHPRAVPIRAATKSRIAPGVAARPIPIPNPIRVSRDDRRLRIEQTISRVCDGGVMTVADGLPVHCYRKRSVRNVWVLDPRSGTRTSMNPNRRSRCVADSSVLALAPPAIFQGAFHAKFHSIHDCMRWNHCGPVCLPRRIARRGG